MASIALDVVAPDGRTAVLFGLVVAQMQTTIALVVVTEDEIWTSVTGLLPPAVPTGDSSSAVWEVKGVSSATVSRRGALEAVEGIELVAAGMGTLAEGDRRGAIGIEMSMSRVTVQRPTECLGDVRVEAQTPSGPIVVEGTGLWQEAQGPPASLISLRGQHMAAGITGGGSWPWLEGLGTSWLWRGGSAEDVVSVKVDPPGDDRAIALVLADQSEVEGRVAVTKRWGIERSVHGGSVAALVVGVVGGAAVVGRTVDPA